MRQFYDYLSLPGFAQITRFTYEGFNPAGIKNSN